MKRYTSSIFLAVLLIAGLCCASTAAAGKSKKESPPPQVQLDQLPADKIDAEVARMDDANVREELLSKLHKDAEAKAAAALEKMDFSAKVRAASVTVGDNLRAMGAALPFFGHEVLRGIGSAADNKGFLGFLELIGSLLLLIACGYLVEWFFRSKTGPAVRDLEKAEPVGGFKKVARAAMRTVLKCINLAAFCAGSALVLMLMYKSESPARLFLAVFLEFFVLIRLTSLASRMFLAPRSVGMRLIDINNQTALKCHKWVMRIAVISLFVRSLVEGLTYAEADLGVIFLLASIKEIIVGLVMAVGVWCFRKPVAEAIRNGAEDPENISLMRSLFAGLWHLLAIFYILLISAFWETKLLLTGEASHAGAYLSSLLIIPLYVWVDKGVQMLLNKAFGEQAPEEDAQPDAEEGAEQEAEATEKAVDDTAETAEEPSTDDEDREEGPKGEAEIIPISAVRRNLPILRGAVRIIIGVILALLMLRFWGIDLPVGDTVTDSAMEIFFTLLGAHLIWEAATSYIAGKLSRTREGTDEQGALARSRTLLPLVRKTLGTFIAIITFLLVLSSLGVNIAPILAGAGIFGLAIGLGTQTLVKDIVAGIFFLMDDAFRVGDYVLLDKNEGYIEKISLRTASVRHYLGSLMVIPFGGIKSVTNYTRGPMTIKYRIPLPLGTDPKMVKKLVKKVNKTIEEDVEMGPNLLQPVKSQGCKIVQDSVMQFGIKFTAKPGTQFRIKRESLHRIQKALAEKGIQFASRSVKIDTSSLMPSPPDAETQKDDAAAPPVQGSAPESPQPEQPAENAPPAPPNLTPEQLAVIEAAAASTLLDEDDPKAKKKKKKK